MNPPPKLFPNGPEWSSAEKVLYGCVDHVYHIGPLRVILIVYEPGARVGDPVLASAGSGDEMRGFSDVAEAITWLRARIIAHRDELVRVTG